MIINSPVEIEAIPNHSRIFICSFRKYAEANITKISFNPVNGKAMESGRYANTKSHITISKAFITKAQITNLSLSSRK